MKSNRRYLAFDIETASTAKDDWRSQRPLGIACAATLLADSPEPRLWHSGVRLSQDKGAALVEYLSNLTVYVRFGVVSSTAASVCVFSSGRSGPLACGG